MACAPLERTPLLRIERGYAPAVLYGYVPTALNGDASFKLALWVVLARP